MEDQSQAKQLLPNDAFLTKRIHPNKVESKTDEDTDSEEHDNSWKSFQKHVRDKVTNKPLAPALSRTAPAVSQKVKKQEEELLAATQRRQFAIEEKEQQRRLKKLKRQTKVDRKKYKDLLEQVTSDTQHDDISEAQAKKKRILEERKNRVSLALKRMPEIQDMRLKQMQDEEDTL